MKLLLNREIVFFFVTVHEMMENILGLAEVPAIGRLFFFGSFFVTLVDFLFDSLCVGELRDLKIDGYIN